jgi:hypothetical protein
MASTAQMLALTEWLKKEYDGKIINFFTHELQKSGFSISRINLQPLHHPPTPLAPTEIRTVHPLKFPSDSDEAPQYQLEVVWLGEASLGGILLVDRLARSLR